MATSDQIQNFLDQLSPSELLEASEQLARALVREYGAKVAEAELKFQASVVVEHAKITA